MRETTRRTALTAEYLALGAGDMGRSVRFGFLRSVFGRRFWRGQNKRLVFDYPAHLRVGNPERGELWLSGDYTLNGGIVRGLGRSPFDLPAPSLGWQESLHGFAWLRHLLVTQGNTGQQQAVELMLRWALQIDRHPAAAMQPAVTAQRLMSWSAAMGRLASALDSRDLSVLQTSLHAQSRWLALTAPRARAGTGRLQAACGLAFSGLIFDDGTDRLRRGMELLNRELKRQVLADGGHISRAPETLARLLGDMLAVKAGLDHRGIAAPAQFDKTIDRMRHLLGLFRHGDGRLACFHGGLELSETELQPLLTGMTTTAIPTFAQRSGYQRIATGKSTLVVDTGDGPAGVDGVRAHAAPLSFEMSSGPDRLIVNCGPNRVHGPDWQLAARSIAAHSTLAFAGNMHDPFLRHGARARRLGPRLLLSDWQSHCRRMEDKSGIWLDMGHGLFIDSHGVRHNRRLFVDTDGEDIRGEELLMPAIDQQPARGAPFHLRFHLHPDVTASLQGGGNAVLLLTPAGHGWQFRTHLSEQTTLNIEESVYMGRRGIPQRSQQIVIRSQLLPGNTVIRWGLRYAGRTVRRRRP